MLSLFVMNILSSGSVTDRQAFFNQNTMKRLIIFKKNLFLLLLLLFQPMQMSFSQNSRSTISNLHINDFAQDSQGYIWIATAKGLNRYNGYTYKLFYHDDENPKSIPSDYVNGLFVDSGKRLWIATSTGVCLYNQEKMSFTHISCNQFSENYFFDFFEKGRDVYVYGSGGIFKVNPGKNLLIDCLLTRNQYNVNTAISDNLGHIWCGCSEGAGIMCFDSSFHLLKKINLSNEVFTSFVYGDKILFGTKRGLLLVNAKTLEIEPFHFPDATYKMQIGLIKKVNDRTFIIGTKNKSFVFYDIYENRIKSKYDLNLFTDATFNHITSFFVDRDRNMWLGSFDAGFTISTNSDKIFNQDKFLHSFITGKFVTRVSEDKNFNLWIGTRYNGLIRYNTLTHQFKEYNIHNFKIFAQQNSDFIQSLFVDSRNRLWIGYDNKLAVCRLSDGNIFSTKCWDNTGDIVTIAEDSRHRIWTGSSTQGICIYGTDLKATKRFMPSPGQMNNITQIISFSASQMLFSSFGDNVYIINIEDLRTSVLSGNPEMNVYCRNAITLLRDRHNHVWIGTYGYGLICYDLRSKRTFPYSLKSGLSSNDILSIAEDNAGNLWLSTSYGLCKLENNYRNIITFFDTDGIGGNQFHEKCLLQRSNNEILFGGNHGITQFNPGKIRPSTNRIPVYLEELRIGNNSEKIDGKDHVLTRNISLTDHITLNNKQNVFSIDYAGLEYGSSYKINYAYKLEGFDKDWNYVGNYRRASYSNLPSGNYVFMIKVENKDGVWSKPITELHIKVLPPLWLYPIPIIIYIIIASAIIYFSINVYVNVRLNNERLAMAKREIDQEKHLTQMKIDFFTNISHELRTPLTLIYGPLQQLIKSRELSSDDEGSTLLKMINNNTLRLLKLIDQLLDFEKVENDTLSLNIRKDDILLRIRCIMDGFSLYAKEKGIELVLNCPESKMIINVDSDKIDKILNNLIFNAIKYTPDNGHVEVKVELTQYPDPGLNLPELRPNSGQSQYLQISVHDDGIGISHGELDHVFERFKRSNSKDAVMQSAKGNGIGLNYVKHLVERHNGNIIVRSNPEGGSVFIFAFPIDAGDVKDLNINEKAIDDNSCKTVGLIDVYEEVADNQDDIEKPVILLVEDHAEMRLFIRNLLKNEYHIVSANNGVEGLDIAREIIPNLIISDVLMPQMNGYELCENIKSDQTLCHVPVVLLTAKTQEQDHIDGYKYGATQYINKPFNPDLLIAIVDNIFAEQKRQQRLIMSGKADSASSKSKENVAAEVKLNPLDQKFMDKLYAYIDKDLAKCDLNVNFLGTDLGFSRTSFYRKVKALTGQVPSDFLRIYRLNKAAEYIMEGEYTLSEISDKCGFGTQSHFSTSFKKYFGVSPKNYKPQSDKNSTENC